MVYTFTTFNLKILDKVDIEQANDFYIEIQILNLNRKHIYRDKLLDEFILYISLSWKPTIRLYEFSVAV